MNKWEQGHDVVTAVAQEEQFILYPMKTKKKLNCNNLMFQFKEAHK